MMIEKSIIKRSRFKFVFTATMVMIFACLLPMLLARETTTKYANVADAAGNTESVSDFTSSDCNFTNLIVFVRFADETEFIDDVYDGLPVRQLINNTYSVSRYSVSDYFFSVSGEKIKMQNMYLFANGGSLQLSRPRGYYAEKDDFNPDGYEYGQEALRRYELKEDWSVAINAAFKNGAKPSSYNEALSYPLSELDKTGDGKIDALTIVYKNATQNINVSWASPLWNYHDYTDFVSFTEDGKTITSSDYVQLTFTYGNSDKTFVYTDPDGCKFLSQSTAAHETGHVFGLKDLYRSANVSKIYYMSLMGKHLSPVGQFLSVKEREAMGWLDEGQLGTLTKEGSYTIRVSGSSAENGVIGYRFDIPGGDKTLYLEYRNFDGSQNKYDCRNKGILLSDGSPLKSIYLKSGLVCYLAKTDMKIPDNFGTTGNNWNYEALGGSSATKNDCALAAGEGLDIPGSSLFIEVESVSETELTFSVYGDELKNNEHVHNIQFVREIAPTCTESGYSAYYRCTECGSVFSDKNGEKETTLSKLILPPTGHTEILLPGKEATCEEDGLTAGKKCLICGIITKEQTVFPKKCHQPGEWIEDKAPTADEEGLRHKECLTCGKTIETEVLPKNTSPDDKDPGGNKDPGEDKDPGGDKGDSPGNDEKPSDKNNELAAIVITGIVVTTIVIVAVLRTHRK